MADIDDVLTMKEAEEYAMKVLRQFTRAVLPDRDLYLFATEYPSSTTEYIVFERLLGAATSGGLGDRPMYYDVDDDGNETYVYSGSTNLMLTAYIGDAYYDLKEFRYKLNNRNLWNTYFGATKGLVSITNVSDVRDTPVPIDGSSSYMTGATMTLTINFPFKYLETTGNSVSSVSFTVTGSQEDNGDGTEASGDLSASDTVSSD